MSAAIFLLDQAIKEQEKVVTDTTTDTKHEIEAGQRAQRLLDNAKGKLADLRAAKATLEAEAKKYQEGHA